MVMVVVGGDDDDGDGDGGCPTRMICLVLSIHASNGASGSGERT